MDNRLDILNRVKLESMIKSSNGKFISVTFTKKNGELRKLHGRLGVKKDLHGGVNKVVKNSNSYMTIWDKQKSAYRTINLSTVTDLHINKKVYVIQ